MAKKYRRPESGTKSAKGGKFYFLAEATMTTTNISVVFSVVVTNAFNNKVTGKVTCDGTTKSKEFKAKGTHKLGTMTFTQQRVPKVTFKCAGESATIAANEIQFTTADPEAPSSITVTYKNDAWFRIDIVGHEYATVPTNQMHVERCVDMFDYNGFSDIQSSPFEVTAGVSHYYIEQTDDMTAERGKRYWYRACAYNNLSQRSSSYIYSGPHYTTADNTGISNAVTATRISNSQIDVTWGISSVTLVNNELVTGFDIYRTEDGGTATLVGHVDADTAHTQYTYSDTTCTADHIYTYMLKTTGNGAEAETFSEASSEVYMSPTAPQSISVAPVSGGDVVVTVINQSKVATQICIERSIDGGAWEQIAEEDYVAGGQTYTDVAPVATDTITYRVRNKCDQLTGTDMYSGYVTSSTVAEKAKPNPPTLKAPISGSSIVLDAGTVRMVFQHNATDGSTQRQAQLRYKLGDEAWTTVSLTTESYYTLDISGYSALDVITWQARTKGAHDDYSDWSDTSTFSILTRPDLTFTSPNNGSVIDTLPITLGWNYNDLSGTLEKLTVIIKKAGKLETSIDVPVGDGTSGTYSYSLAEYLFENQTVYTITATALSSSGFTDIADIAITISYEEVSLEGGLIPTVSFDDDAIAYIVMSRDITPDDEDVVPEPLGMSQACLYRVHDGIRTLIASGLDEGSQVVDKHAPINIEYSYELLMLTTGGAVSIVSVDVYQESTLWYVYWDDGIARAEWDPDGKISLKRPEKTQVRYSGREYPVTYDSKAMEETISFNFTLVDREELNNFRHMIRDGGHGIWKSGDGDVFDADFEFDYSASYYQTELKWDCSLNVTRTSGD